jgi:hypothetical protein
VHPAHRESAFLPGAERAAVELISEIAALRGDSILAVVFANLLRSAILRRRAACCSL